MLRVISGSARNLLLKTPDGLETRPTTDRIKETLFNMLQTQVPGAVVVDFFAGSGSLGIESLSRGASHAYFVDNSREANNCIVENIKHTHFEDKATVFSQDTRTAASMIHENFVDIIFMDPPYNKGLEKEMLEVLKKMPYVTEDTLIVIEASLDTSFDYLEDLGYELYKEKRYKTNKHIFVYPLSEE
ncbi:MAG: 16S rRNA (guanine(966)-N(2))-methyltransferase RsmD [Lachnospiraceae bacterium]|nr:16S rRNA (guanine(966)-N(2))-methyltransferase RsmD [Lachnospiraceae bacterium]